MLKNMGGGSISKTSVNSFIKLLDADSNFCYFLD